MDGCKINGNYRYLFAFKRQQFVLKILLMKLVLIKTLTTFALLGIADALKVGNGVSSQDSLAAEVNRTGSESMVNHGLDDSTIHLSQID